MKGMKRTDSKKYKLGLFVFISTIFLISALYFIGKKQNLFGKTSYLTAVFKNVNGLQLGNNVRYSGINSGTVKAIEMKNDSTIYVFMVIENKMLKHIKKNAVASIGSDGLVGSMVINILPVNLPADPLIPGDTIRSVMKINTSDMLSTLNVTNKNAVLLTADLLKITKDINSGKGTLGKLISDTVMANDMSQIIRSLKLSSIKASKTVHNLNNMIREVKNGNNMAAILLNDTISADKLRSVIDNLDRSGKGIDTLITSLNETINDYKNSSGTLNVLVKDTAMADDIEITVKNIKEGSIKLNEDLEALKHHFLFRGYFKKLDKEQKKANK
jgi:phospholipid/cholesterol/gamma-HCH transport system substrate-binding protein